MVYMKLIKGKEGSKISAILWIRKNENGLVKKGRIR